MRQIHTLVFDIGGTSVKSGVVSTSKDGQSLDLLTNEVIKSQTFAEVYSIVTERISSAGLERVGIATTGSIDQSGIVLRAGAIRGYENVDWRKLVAKSPQCSGKRHVIAVANDGQAAAWGEYCLRSERGTTNTVHFVVGTGVGGGAVINGHLLKGQSGLAGAFGHLKAADARGICVCGASGCVELAASGAAIVRVAREQKISERLVERGEDRLQGLQDVVLAAQGGDVAAREIFVQAGASLGAAIASVVNALNPGLVTIGGGVIAAAREISRDIEANVYVDSAAKVALETSLGRAAADVTIRAATAGNEAALFELAVLSL